MASRSRIVQMFNKLGMLYVTRSDFTQGSNQFVSLTQRIRHVQNQIIYLVQESCNVD
jgi:hypothetical protein